MNKSKKVKSNFRLKSKWYSVPFFLLIFAFFLLISSCTTQKELTYLNNLDTSSVSQFFPLERPDYRIQYQDILYVNITTMNPEQNNLLNPGNVGGRSTMFQGVESMYIFGYTVSDTGTISLPVLGEVKVQGLTLSEVKNAIENRAAQYLKDASINIRLLSFKITVIGEINNPGTYANFNNQLTILDAIAMGGDITDYGDRSKVLLVRPEKDGISTYRINLHDKNLLQSEAYFLLPNDIVIVEPIKSKPFLLNLPTTTFMISTSLTTFSTVLLLISFLNRN